MQIPSLYFLLAAAIIFYLGTFLLFAILRVVTGISIQRVGFSSLRRISFSPKEGIRIDIRGLGWSLHRPTFAQPTWISVVLSELTVTVDLKLLGSQRHRATGHRRGINGSASKVSIPQTPPYSPTPSENGSLDESGDGDEQRSRTWEQLTDLKEKIKRLHRKITWIRMVDLVATASTCAIVDVGAVQIGSFTMAVDTRRKTVDRTRLFQHKAKANAQQPAEWIFTLRSVLFTPEGKDSSEILDHCTLNVHGFLYQELDGLRDASVALKLGRVSLPYDDIQGCMEEMKRIRHIYGRQTINASDVSLHEVMDELEKPGSREERIVRAVSDSREFVSSILRGIHEIQFAISLFGITRRVPMTRSKHPVYVNTSMKELSLDVLRLDPKSPAHRMYFSPNDIAHQALIAVVGISIGVDDGHEQPDRLLYIPMATATMRTTLPSKTIQMSRGQEKTFDERNTNILYANLVFTSPSVDFDPKHLPLVLAIIQARKIRVGGQHQHSKGRHRLISRLLPKASVKISIHEPVIRVSLPPQHAASHSDNEFDLLIATMSLVSLDLDSSHSSSGESHYRISSNLRVTSHHLYYQTSINDRHNLLLTDTMELKVQVSATPDILVMVEGDLKTFSIYMVRPEICEGVRQILSHLRSDMIGRRDSSVATSAKQSFIRSMPLWLRHFHFSGSDINFEIAGYDSTVSSTARGLAFQLASWDAEYKADRTDDTAVFLSARRPTSSVRRADDSPRAASPSPARKRQGSISDGRRLAVHLQGLGGHVMESVENWEPDPFFSVPRFEVAFSTSTDMQGPVFHINSMAREIHIHYSLSRHYAIGVAAMVLRDTLTKQPESPSPSSPSSPLSPQDAPNIFDADIRRTPIGPPEITIIDFRSTLLQLKATMPTDPPLMIQLYGFEVGRHRWSLPFLRTRLIRLYARSPKIKESWSRIVGVKSLRLDIREQRRKQGLTIVQERTVDIVTEAIRIGVPHQLVIHTIFDNITNVVKTTKQLHHRFTTNTDEDVLQKLPEGPKLVPKISLRSQIFVFEIEDDSFEWKLGTIYRLGLIEQQQRLARAEAFKLKVKKLEQTNAKKGSRRGKSHVRSRSKPGADDQQEKIVTDADAPKPTGRSASPATRPEKRMRYDAEGRCGMSGDARRNIQQAQERLNIHNSQSWKKRIDRGIKFQNRAMKDIRSVLWGVEEMPSDVEQKETVLGVPQRPALAAFIVSDFGVIIDRPSFPVQQYPDFLHRIGKGMPKDMQYGLLVPMNLNISMGEVRATLRDYPLPMLHVPAIRPGQSPRLPSLSLRADFVVAEEFRGQESTRHVRVTVVPPENKDGQHLSKGLIIDVPRTVSPVKTFSDVKVDVNTGAATRFTWGTSYQPAIQDMMQVIEGFTKPPVDPSERVGFWDKIRLNFHSRVNVAWKGDGDVHLILKGSRDPYMVTQQGAGFVMCWRNDVRWSVCEDPDPRKFMTVNSGDYVLAVPDFSHYARHSLATDKGERDSINSSASGARAGQMFKKVVMKLSGNVQWLAGLVFERDIGDGQRSFKFKPHYEVVLKNPDQYSNPLPPDYDAYRGFRSHHIHMSVAIVAPMDRDWSFTNLRPSSNYNSIHLSPRLFTHFFSWWSMFQGAMSLPVRQGSLWPGPEKSSKKFGRHLATMKYNFLLSPVFLSHIYKHKDAEDYSSSTVSATGIKMRLDSFMLDLHQRREEYRTLMPGVNKQNRTSRMKINQCQLDFISADFRAVSASIKGTSTSDVENAPDDVLASIGQGDLPTTPDMSQFEIPDNDFAWIDMDDFIELDWILPIQHQPETRILPLAYAPRFSYFRQTDHQHAKAANTEKVSPFGNEPTHFCVMSAKNDPRRVQVDLIDERLRRIAEQLGQNERAVGETELQVIRDSSTSSQNLKAELEMLQQHSAALQGKQEFLGAMRRTLQGRLENDDKRAVPDPDSTEEWFEARTRPEEDGYMGSIDSAPLADYTSDFNNRFIVHNAQIKWNNSLRNIILRYIHQVSQRRGFVYYMSRRAVKFILDILDEQDQSRAATGAPTTPGKRHSEPTTPEDVQDEDGVDIRERIEQLLTDSKKFVDADDPADIPEHVNKRHDGDNMNQDIATEFTPQNSYHVRLIAPQIQLQSEKSRKSAVLVTAKGMQLKVIQIMDKDRVTDDVSGLVQRRFAAAMDSVQFFVTSTKTFSTEYLHMYSGNNYGTAVGASWPPWVPLEVMFEFHANPYGFHRIVQRTSASLRYDKYNTLRLKYNDDVTGATESGRGQAAENPESRMDHLWIEFPNLRAICDSAQYYAMYVIVMDLLMYSEPLEKTRSERLEKIMLASDFSDLTGAPEMVIMLQERIRQLEEIKMHFQINERYLDKRGWQDRIAIDQDLVVCEDELFFMMKAITTSQRRSDDKGHDAQSNGLLRWYLSASEIAWHLVREKNESLLEFQLRNASYERTDNNDGSNYNDMQIESMKGLNLLPDALYPEIIKPYVDTAKSMLESHNPKMLQVRWYMLEAIAGIPVVDHFEINLIPLKVQLEREVGSKLFEYVFPGLGANAAENGGSSSGGFSPFMVKHMQPAPEADDDEANGWHAVESPRHAFSNSGGLDAGPESKGHGSLEMRLQPTLTLPDKKPRTAGSLPKPGREASHRLGIFNHGSRSRSSTPRGLGPHNKATSTDSLSSMARSKPDRGSPDASIVEGGSGNLDRSRPANFLQRSTSKENKGKDRDTQPSDDLSQMMSRASNYMTLAYFKVTSVVLCLSYKGKGHRNIEDVHDLVFRMPTVEYRNKTWSNLDLALQLKKDVIRALISHAGAIVGNKFSHHRPNKAQQSRLREIANSSTFLASGEWNRPGSDDHLSARSHPLEDEDRHDAFSMALSTSEPRQSFASSSRGSQSHSMRTNSWGSSLKSGNSTPPASAGQTPRRSQSLHSSSSVAEGLSSATAVTPSASTSAMKTTSRQEASARAVSMNTNIQPSMGSANRNVPGLGIHLTPATPVEGPSPAEGPETGLGSGRINSFGAGANTLGRRLSGLSQRLGSRQSEGPNGGEEETEASTRRKSKLLLGSKKFLNSIPHP
ncbi:MAG: hypothetical protein M1821_000026 [Bathelium mastoideum]|nr:MAG: hypothetical protein M1821_000026 [Bathelium mastoideum]